MIIDNKGKLFGKINIIDVCVILIIAIAIGVTYFKFNLSAHSDVTTTNSKATYTIRATKVRSFTADSISVGDKVFDRETDKFVGTVVDVTKKGATDYIELNNGSVVKADVPERYNVDVTIECPAIVRGGAIVTESGKQIYVNQQGAYYTQTVETEFKTISVSAQ